MNEFISIILITLISSITLTFLLILLVFLIPNRVERTRQVINRAPGRAFLIGFVNTLFFGVLATSFASSGDEGGFIALLILLALGSLALIGLSGMVVTVRERIYPEMSENGLKEGLKTAVFIIIASLTPFIGWFVLTPILLIIGLGGAITTLVRREKKLSVNGNQ